MEYRDYYATLGVPRTASQAEIKKAFRRLARRHHPDVNAGNAAAERRFKEINEAHEVLSDPEKRQLYDRLGADWEEIQRAGAGATTHGGGRDPFAGFAGGGPGVRFEYHGDPADVAGFSDFFRTFFVGGAGPAAGAPTGTAAGSRASSARGRGQPASGARGAGLDFDDILAGLGIDASGGGGFGSASREAAAGPAPPEPQHLQAPLEITLEEASTGATRLVQIGGRRLEVKIPAGVASGQRIRLSGTAGTGPSAGNLYLVVRVRDHPVFTRRGDDLLRELPVTLSQAVLGGQVAVGTLKGRVLLKLPPGTQNGRTFRLAGQGMPRWRAGGAGDLLVKVRVVLPGPLDEEGRRLFKAFADHVDQPAPRTGAATP